jgi:hypothetical protein
MELDEAAIAASRGSVGGGGMIKRLMMMSMLASAVGVPYVLSTGSAWVSSIKSQFTSTEAPAKLTPPADKNSTLATSRAVLDLPAAMPGSNRKLPPVEGYGAQDLAEVLNFNATPQWVMARWPRVTVGLAELDLQGYRVPLVTGTREDDLAGSLTYYFDPEQRLQLIHFRGKTGNPHKLVRLVMSQYGLVPQPSPDPGLQLFQLKWNGKPISELQVRTANLVRAAQPNARFQIEMGLKRP